MLLHAWAKKFATDSNATWGLRGYHIEALIVAPAALILLTVIALIYDPLAVKAAFTAVVGHVAGMGAYLSGKFLLDQLDRLHPLHVLVLAEDDAA